MKKLIKYIKDYNGSLFLSAGFHLLTAVFTVVSIPLIIPFFQILFERDVTRYSKPESLTAVADWVKFYSSELLNNYDKIDALLMVCGVIIGVFFLKNLFRYLAAYFIIPLRNGVVKSIRKDLYAAFLNLNASYYDKHSRGDLISRINADANEIEYSILSYLEVLFKSPLIIVGSLAFMLYVSPQLSIFVLFLLIFTVLVIGFVSRKLKQSSTEVQEGVGRLTSLVEQSLAGVEVIKSYQAEGFLEEKFEQENESIFKGMNRIFRRKDLSSPLSEFLGVSIVAILLAFGSSLVFKGEIMPETFFAFIFAFYQVIEPAKSFSTAYFNVKKGNAAVDRVEEILQASNRNTDLKRDHLIPHKWTALHFNKLDFSYQETEDKLERSSTLININFKLERGEKMAIVGASGSGKSTILKLLLQQYLPSKGQIKIDDQDLSKVKLDELRNMIAIVNQSPILFRDSIKNNILLGRNLDANKMNAILEELGLNTLLEKLPKGVDTLIGDSGGLLSGGEKQRICIARALYGDPEILLFDEATSALDSKSEEAVGQAIHNAIKNRTAIIIAHRLTTIKLVDHILVIEDGKVEQLGDIKTLTKEKGKFKTYLESYKSI